MHWHAPRDKNDGQHRAGEQQGGGIEHFMQQGCRGQHRQERLQQLQLRDAHGATQRKSPVPGQKTQPHRHHGDIGEAAPGRELHRGCGPQPPRRRHGDGKAEHQRPADDLPGRARPREVAAQGIAHRSRQHGTHQQAIGPVQIQGEVSGAVQQGVGHHQGRAQNGAEPEPGRRPLARQQRAKRCGKQGQQRQNERGMHRIDFAQGDGSQQRKTEHHAASHRGQQSPVAAAGQGRALPHQPDGCEHARNGRATERHELGRELRRLRRADGQARHRQRERKQTHAQQAQSQRFALRGDRWLLSNGGCGWCGHGTQLRVQCDTPPIHLMSTKQPLYG